MKLKKVIKWTGIAILAALILAFLVGFIAYWRSTNDCDRNTGIPANPMKAIVHCEYGSPDVLTLADVEKPIPNDNQLLVRVRAAAVNPLDLTIRGPWLMRPISGCANQRTLDSVSITQERLKQSEKRNAVQTWRRSIRRERRGHRRVYLCFSGSSGYV